MCAKSHMRSSEGIPSPARYALSHRYRAVSQRFVPEFVPKRADRQPLSAW